jgi:hypothetical protein
MIKELGNMETPGFYDRVRAIIPKEEHDIIDKIQQDTGKWAEPFLEILYGAWIQDKRRTDNDKAHRE